MTTGIQTLLFDIGGVVLSNAWDHQQRAQAAAHFGLDAAALEERHAQLAPELETGQIGLDEYLARAVFEQPRAFAAGAFREYLFAFSQPQPEVIALLGEIAAGGRMRLATVNNEGRELNQYRIERFGLRRLFTVFCSSCYLGARKPGAEIFRRALGVLQAAPEACLFIDDREENLVAPRALGIASVRFESAGQLRQELLGRRLL